MDKIVFCNNNKVLTSSRTVATTFDKEHKNVLRDIRKIIKNMAHESHNSNMSHEISDYFIESSYISDRGRKEVQYLLTKDGFTLLAMGYSGPKALRFKLDYIAAYNAMEQSLIALREEKLELEAKLAEYEKEVLNRSLDRTIQALEDAEYKCNKLEEHYEELRQYNKELAEDKEAWVTYAEDLENFIKERIARY